MDSAHCGLPETDRGDQKRLVLLQGFRVPPPLAPGGPGVPSAGASLLEAGLLAGTPGTAGEQGVAPTAQAGHTEVIPETLWIHSAIVQLTSSESCSAP